MTRFVLTLIVAMAYGLVRALYAAPSLSVQQAVKQGAAQLPQFVQSPIVPIATALAIVALVVVWGTYLASLRGRS